MRGTGRIDLNALRRDGAQPAAALAPDAALDATVERSPLEEATFLLTAAAEIEHVLMVQYLFAAYSLNPASAGLTADQVKEIKAIKEAILQIAREEMGHLITVQNLLLLIGAPLWLGREHSPFVSDIYPFRFKLEALSLTSLAKYAVAESPDLPSSQIPSLDPTQRVLFDNVIKPAAAASNDGKIVGYVGPIYKRLADKLGSLADADFRLDRADYQARWADWGLEPKGVLAQKTLVEHFDATTADAARNKAVAAAGQIGDQGEAADFGPGADSKESHFERFFDLYERLKKVVDTHGRVPTWDVLENPNTAVAAPPPAPAGNVVEQAMAEHAAKGRITDARARGWADLFNLRYGLLLQCLQHSLLRNDLPYTANGDRTPKGLLQYWTFTEMRRVKKLAEKLVQMPSGVGSKKAGPPFELPFTLALPALEPDRWRVHASTFVGCLARTTSLLAGPDAADPFLNWLVKSDEQARAIAVEVANSGSLPAGPSPKRFLQTLTILEESMRGFVPDEQHDSFWRGAGRDAFIAAKPGSSPVVVPGNAAGSPLQQRIALSETSSKRMPKFRPRIHQSRIEHIRKWIADGAPDDTPPSILSVEPDPSPEPH